jgi:exopolysaccharide biosynthesis polyprenyl glycosylphosphotransferase
MAASLPFHMLERVAGSCFRIGATVSILPQHLKKMTGTRLEVRQTPIGAFLQLRPVRLALPQLAVKRTMDMVLAATGLAVTSPLLLAIAAAIRLESRGPILFRQTRAGVGGHPFHMLKFRTMRDGADADKSRLQHLNESRDSRLFKIKHDPRVTRVGRLLRRLSLDELPQLFNVLRGDMSLVGPRPFFPGDLEQYERHHFERLYVLPGITGLWQVSGRSDITDFEEVIRLDREYIESWTIMSDFTIMARTVPAMLRRGAY